MERDELKYFNVSFYKNFNSHAHVERDTANKATSISLINFNSHAHVERDLKNPVVVYKEYKFQLTRSRGA